MSDTAPPPVPGTRPPRPWEPARFGWWTIKGYTYGLAHGSIADRLMSLTVLAVTLMPVWLAFAAAPSPVVVASALCPAVVWLAPYRDYLDPHTTVYVSEDTTAVMALRARAGCWQATNHMSVRPGHGHGATLRQLIIPALGPVLAARGLVLYTGAATAGLRDAYMREIPALRCLGRVCPRGYRLVLAPDPSKE